jgi:ketosteroid isomerase-like protein
MPIRFFLLSITFLLFSSGSILFAQSDEEAIRQRIQDETADFCKMSIADLCKKHWIMDDKSFMLVTLIDGVTLISKKEDLIQDTTVPPDGHAKIEKTDYVISITGNTAYAYHHETATLQDGGKITAHQVRVLEKVDGVWKIHASSVHQYKNN